MPWGSGKTVMHGGTAGAAPVPAPRNGTSAQAPSPAEGRHHVRAITQRFIAFQAADSPRDLNPIKFLLAVT